MVSFGYSLKMCFSTSTKHQNYQEFFLIYKCLGSPHQKCIFYLFWVSHRYEYFKRFPGESYVLPIFKTNDQRDHHRVCLHFRGPEIIGKTRCSFVYLPSSISFTYETNKLWPNKKKKGLLGKSWLFLLLFVCFAPVLRFGQFYVENRGGI